MVIVGEGFHSRRVPSGGVGARPVDGLIGVSIFSMLFSRGFRNIFSRYPLLRLHVKFYASMLPAAFKRGVDDKHSRNLNQHVVR